MNFGKGKILIVDDNEDVLLSLNMLLRPRVEAIRVLKNPERILEMMDSFGPDVIILDMNFTRDAVSGEEGFYWLSQIKRHNPLTVVLFITAFVDTAKAVRAIKAGAIDFIPKPWQKGKIIETVESAVELRHSSAEPKEAPKEKSASVVGFKAEKVEMIGTSDRMEQIRSQIALVAPTDANVLITGENGTGKDVVARLIHSQSARSGKPFVAIDLGSIPEHLFESELFGYEKGAFTDAKTAKPGRIEMADGGTLFLDEIGNLSPLMQQKLLTVIEKREFSRIGSIVPRHVDVRFVSATNANLAQRVAEGTFRQDLLYRINTIALHLPPLRQRGSDILLLANHFAQLMARRYKKPAPKLSAKFKERLLAYSWPGNVRELQHVMERYVILAPAIDDLFPEKADSQSPSPSDEGWGGALTLAELERQAILRAISISNGNLSQAAEILGITRFALYRKLEKMKEQ